MIKTVLDTNILISATFWSGSSYQITLLAIQQKIVCYTSPSTIKEYARALKRDFKQNDNQIEERINAVLSFLQLVKPTVSVRIVKEDPDDDKIIEAALTAKVQYIVTGDKHLLKIKKYQNVKIVTPRAFLKEL